ncbi:uncharacterized protein LOC116845012 [Odontomachus brunneus]|uniref:uncharacterized protein LOC116845012 n=1 Tax=Odontomachus brunneus TaxID=486640 RepID=UPI0013F17F87|nr:uncharacterized protein LOC116845012 [Odontomachus brunneus]
MLVLEKKRKKNVSGSNTNIGNKIIKVRGRTGIPTYSDLLQCNKIEDAEVYLINKIKMKGAPEINEREKKGERKKDETYEIHETDKKEDHNYSMKLNINQQIGNDKNNTSKMLLELLIRSEEKNKKLLQTNKDLIGINKLLNIQIKELQMNARNNSVITQKRIYKRKPKALSSMLYGKFLHQSK